MKLVLFVLPTLLLVAACGDDSTGKPDFATAADDLSANDDMNAGDLKPDLSAPDLTPVGPSGMILQVRNMADSMSTPDGGMISMPVHDVYVTGLRPLVTAGADPAGFFVQAEQLGPALFVAVDPASLSPAAQVGDLVRFNVTSVQKLSGTRQAGSIDSWTVVSSGTPVAPLAKDVTLATDLISGLENYESELVKITSATIAAPFTPSATGYVAATITTTGQPTMNSKLKLRIPTTLRDLLDVSTGCVVAIGPSPLWRYFDTAEPSAWLAADLPVASCPAPRVVSAAASDDHTLVVTFDRMINGTSLLANGSQFTFNAGLTASAATLTGPSQVTVTTSPQVGSTAYTVTVAATLTDTRALGIDAANNTANFSGFVVPAVLMLNEVNAAIASNKDLIELKVVTGGSLVNYTLYQDVSAGTRVLLATLPALTVATGDYVVVHLKPVVTVTTETNAGGMAGCTDATCVAGAWDVASGTTADIGNSARVVTLNKPNGALVDAFAFSNGSGHPAVWPTEMKAILTAAFWLPNACPNNCAAAADADTLAVPVGSSTTGTQNTVAGRSAQRVTNNIPGQVSDWTVKVSTWGAAN